jgi:catechol 2,3-dioxygenase-like lactoylglutathione lyase family enzyme
MVNSCIPIIPTADVERSLRLFRDGLGFDETWWEAQSGGKLTAAGIRKGHISFMFNLPAEGTEKPAHYEGVRFYWAPDDLRSLHTKLSGMGYVVSDIHDRDYGQTEFFLTDDDGFEHCFGVPTENVH